MSDQSNFSEKRPVKNQPDPIGSLEEISQQAQNQSLLMDGKGALFQKPTSETKITFRHKQYLASTALLNLLNTLSLLRFGIFSSLIFFFISFSYSQLANGPWPMFQHDARHTGRSGFPGSSSSQVKWKFNYGEEASSGHPVVGPGGIIYFSAETPANSGKSKLFAVNFDGTLRFETNLGGRAGGIPALASDGTIYVMTGTSSGGDADLYAYTSTGSVKWTKSFNPFNEIVSKLPTIGPDGTIYVAGGGITAVRPDGTTKWAYETEHRNSQPAVIGADGSIIFLAGVTAPLIFSLDPNNGTENWKKGLGANFNPSAPSVGPDGTIYAYVGGHLFATSSDGAEKWKSSFLGNGKSSTPAITSSGTIVIAVSDSFDPRTIVYGINSANGEVSSRFTIDAGGAPALALDSNGVPYVSLGAGAGGGTGIKLVGGSMWSKSAYSGNSSVAIGTDETTYSILRGDNNEPWTLYAFSSNVSVNNSPTANAGSEQTVVSGEIVTLDGTGSSDPDGDTLSFSWSQIVGTSVTLSDPNTAQPSFTAPSVDSQTILTFRLTVSDGELSDQDEVNVTVNPIEDDSPPSLTSWSTSPRSGEAGDFVTFNYTINNPRSSNLDVFLGATMFPAGTNQNFDYIPGNKTVSAPPGTSSHSRNFLIRDSQGPGSYDVLWSIWSGDPGAGGELFDQKKESNYFTVNEPEPTNRAPTANAGSDQTVTSGQKVMLDGRGSSDPDGDSLSFSWIQVSGPPVSLSESSTATPSFTAPDVDSQTTLTFRLTVSDGELTEQDDIMITVEPQLPDLSILKVVPHVKGDVEKWPVQAEDAILSIFLRNEGTGSFDSRVVQVVVTVSRNESGKEIPMQGGSFEVEVPVLEPGEAASSPIDVPFIFLSSFSDQLKVQLFPLTGDRLIDHNLSNNSILLPGFAADPNPEAYTNCFLELSTAATAGLGKAGWNIVLPTTRSSLKLTRAVRSRDFRRFGEVLSQELISIVGSQLCGDFNACSGFEKIEATGSLLSFLQPFVEDWNGRGCGTVLPDTGIFLKNIFTGMFATLGNKIADTGKKLFGFIVGSPVDLVIKDSSGQFVTVAVDGAITSNIPESAAAYAVGDLPVKAVALLGNDTYISTLRGRAQGEATLEITKSSKATEGEVQVISFEDSNCIAGQGLSLSRS